MKLDELRRRINEVDAALLPLFLQRMRLAEEVAAVKKAEGLPVLNARREEEILSRVAAEAGEYAGYARALYQRLFELSRMRQQELMDGGPDPEEHREA